MNGDEDKEYKDNEEEDEFGEFTGADDDNNIEKEKHETCTSDVEVIEQNTRGCVQPLSRSSVDVPVLDHLVGKSYAERVRWVREDLKNRRGGMRGDDCGDDLGRSCVYDMKELEERYGEVLKVGSVEGLTRPGWHGSACEGRLRERLGIQVQNVPSPQDITQRHDSVVNNEMTGNGDASHQMNNHDETGNMQARVGG